MTYVKIKYGLAASSILVFVLVTVYFTNYFNFTEFKNTFRSIEAVGYLQNLVYHWQFPPVSPVAAGDGNPANRITLLEPASIAEAPDGSVFISDRRQRIWKVGLDGTARVVAGNGYKGSIDTSVTARMSKLGRPQGLAVDPQGRVYFADSYNDVVARVNDLGEIEVVAGTGVRGFNGEEGLATELKLDKPYDVAVDDDGNIYIIENGNHRLRKVTPDGHMVTLAGAGELGPSYDPQPAKTAKFLSPWGLFVDKAARVYVCDGGTHVVRRVNPDGTIERVAGIGTPGYLGDGASALDAQLNAPESIYVRSDGSLLIEDEFNNVIRLVDPNGMISTIAGIGEPSDLFDPMDALQTGLNDPEDVIETQDGSILIADHLNRRVISIHPDGSAEIFAGQVESGPDSETEIGLLQH